MQINVALLGLGNIGSGVFRVLQRQQEALLERENVVVQIKRVLVRDVNKPRSVQVERSLLTDRVEDILEDPTIDIVAEFMGGVEPARTYLVQALNRGMTVVTANKAVVACCWEELDEAARKSGAGLYYEASVAGGIPVIGTFNRSLQANKILEVMGIVNGTTNAILTNMSERGWSYEAALADAQAKGYAEPDPSMDVGGQDAVYKLSILASLAFGQRIRIEDIHCEGITTITPEDIAFGKSLGLTLKLLAIGRVEEDRLQVRVHPTFIPDGHPIASVRRAYNAVFLHGDAIGHAMLYGRGAGDLPTASAIVSDIVMAAKNAGKHEHPAFLLGREQDALPLEKNWLTACYVHLLVNDTPGALASIAGVMGKYGVSLATVNQISRNTPVPLVLVTHPARELSIQAAMAEIQELEAVDRVVNVIRVEKEG